MRYVAAFCMLALISPNMTLAAEDAATQEKVAQLEQQVRLLQARVAMLEAELSAARTALAEKDQAAPSHAKPVEAAAEAKAEGAPTPEVRVYTSIRQLLGALPPDARPHPVTGWDASRRDKAAAWLKDNTPGAKFRAQLSVKLGVGVRLPVKRNGETGFEHHHSLTVTAPFLTFAGQQIRPHFAGAAVRGDVERIEAIQRATAADSIPISATIATVTLLPVNDAWVLNIHLADVKLEHPALQ